MEHTHHVGSGLLLIAYGVFAVLRPETVIWWDSDGWLFRDGEAPDWFVRLVQLQGLISVVAGVGLMFGWWGGGFPSLLGFI